MPSTTQPTPTFIPSDSLKDLRTLLAIWAGLRPLIGNILQVRIVIDTNMVIAELLELAKPHWVADYRTRLQELMASETAICYAPGQLQDEMARHWPRIAKERGISQALAATLWQDYAKGLRFCDVAINPLECADVQDSTDLPFTLLASQIAAHGVYSRDKDIPAMGAHVITVDCILGLRDYARNKAVEVTIQVGSAVLVAVGFGVLLLAFRALKGILAGFMQLPPAAQLLIVLGILWALANEGRRKKLLGLLQSVGPYLTQMLGGPLNDGQEALAKAMPLVRQALSRVEQGIQHQPRVPLCLLIRAVLSGVAGPLCLRQIEISVRAAGYSTKAQNLQPYIQRILRQDDAFCETLGGGWRVVTL